MGNLNCGYKKRLSQYLNSIDCLKFKSFRIFFHSEFCPFISVRAVSEKNQNKTNFPFRVFWQSACLSLFHDSWPQLWFGTIMVELASLPSELLTQIFYRLDQTTLTRTCTLVCSSWKKTIEEMGEQKLCADGFVLILLKYLLVCHSETDLIRSNWCTTHDWLNLT